MKLVLLSLLFSCPLIADEVRILTETPIYQKSKGKIVTIGQAKPEDSFRLLRNSSKWLTIRYGGKPAVIAAADAEIRSDGGGYERSPASLRRAGNQGDSQLGMEVLGGWQDSYIGFGGGLGFSLRVAQLSPAWNVHAGLGAMYFPAAGSALGGGSSASVLEVLATAKFLYRSSRKFAFGPEAGLAWMRFSIGDAGSSKSTSPTTFTIPGENGGPSTTYSIPQSGSNASSLSGLSASQIGFVAGGLASYTISDDVSLVGRTRLFFSNGTSLQLSAGAEFQF